MIWSTWVCQMAHLVKVSGDFGRWNPPNILSFEMTLNKSRTPTNHTQQKPMYYKYWTWIITWLPKWKTNQHWPTMLHVSFLRKRLVNKLTHFHSYLVSFSHRITHPFHVGSPPFLSPSPMIFIWIMNCSLNIIIYIYASTHMHG